MNHLRRAFADQFGIHHNNRKVLTPSRIARLQACKDDPSRRILLGVTEKGETGYIPSAGLLLPQEQLRSMSEDARLILVGMYKRNQM